MKTENLNEVQLKQIIKECNDRLREIYKIKHLGQMYCIGSTYKDKELSVWECSLCGWRNTENLCLNKECPNSRRKHEHN
jgi:hypothetical protein